MRQSTKYGEIIHHIYGLIEEKKILPGNGLPSISELSRTLSVARETVVKAYKILKQEGLIDSVPGKGFFLLTDRISSGSRVLLILNSFNPYMQVLYNSFAEALPEGVTADVYFHHNSYETLRNLLESSRKRYTHCIVKPFQDKRVPDLLENLDSRRTLILDRGEYSPDGFSYLCQDFSGGIKDALLQVLERIKSYDSLNLIRAVNNPHPEESFQAFSSFLSEQKIPGEIIPGFDKTMIRKGSAYLLLTEQDLVSVLSVVSDKGWIPGKDLGILSYNDFPLLEYVAGGISSLSIDFEKMGERAAQFPLMNVGINEILKPGLILRSSF
ncbi:MULTISPECIES: GntR family transcriptional regulator [unclassified Oceanispirochaeta]|uniref:GntR family transcriptional regulator n=1 Tax=unclassified Oceanispirochaeta TaxID=2635722 RepID=UPI000E098A61|nr:MULTISPECIES: GntR family transcriptional regulator [unclassified Oceanispirochaeta]MBF9018137.1 GntR family transcriptional regulator [Oceanispirochaeta sp. M2]NPD74601.1 GntR family transcriptional regulator [Oceanispirochaeta sp. M1]RDG29553.1 GntR family transcriptional regulator [Oceanispirochaeta sp. M1]